MQILTPEDTPLTRHQCSNFCYRDNINPRNDKD